MPGMFNYKLAEEAKCAFYDIAGIDELPAGERLFLEMGDLSIVVFNIAGEYYAIADVCSHDDGPLGDGELDGYVVKCPRHGARFDVRSGEVLSLPAVVDIPAYPIRLNGGRIEIGIPES